jgi:dihydrofolate reductase
MSKTILYMEISKDGFIAGKNDETPWTDDAWQAFQKFVRTCDAVLVGRRTYEIMRQEDDFMDDVRYIVVTEDESLDTLDYPKLSIKSKADMPDVERLGIIGGGELNGRLAELGVIDEMILDIEPVTLGEGIRLFGTHEVPLKLELLASNKIGKATVQRHYKILDTDTED